MSSARRILVIDDEATIRNLLRVHLHNAGFEIAEAETGERGLVRALEFHPHLVVLDLGLPDQSGLAVIPQLRRWTSIPIIVLTVNDDETVKVQALDAGADDYLTKPFGIPELLARIRVALRHHHSAEATPRFVSGDLEIDLNKRAVSRGGETVRLTNTEFELLSHLVRSPGRVVSAARLLTEVWGPHGKDQPHYLRIYIGQLRKKLEADASTPAHILTEPGVGYRIV